MKTTDEPIVVCQDFHFTVERLWSSITTHSEMIQWFFKEIPNFEATTGFKTHFIVNTGDREFDHLWTILEAIPNQKIVYNWKYKGYAGDSNVIFSISEINNGCRLCVECQVLEDFDDTIPEFQRESILGGWTYYIQESLKGYLDLQINK